MEPYQHQTTGRVPGSTGLGSRVSASSFLTPAEQLREYQASFMATVHGEVERLVRCGYRREDAVEALLRRIRSLSADAALPTDKEVTSLMRSHRLSREDATRALVVRNAVSCLRRKGWDSASVMQELTSQLMASDPPPSLTARQQQQAHPPSPGGFRTGMKRPLSAMGQGLMPGVSDGEDEEEEERKMGARGAVEVAAADEEGGAGGGSDAMMMQLVSPRKRACYGKVPPPSCVGVVGEPAQARDWSMMYSSSSSSRDHGNTSNHQQHHFHAEPHQQHHLHQYGGAAQW